MQRDSFYSNGRRITMMESKETPGSFDIIEQIRKRTLAHLDVRVPGRELDYRISAKEEIPLGVHELPAPDEKPLFEREKARMSYQCGPWRADLTKATQHELAGSEKRAVIVYEVELEVIGAHALHMGALGGAMERNMAAFAALVSFRRRPVAK